MALLILAGIGTVAFAGLMPLFHDTLKHYFLKAIGARTTPPPAVPRRMWAGLVAAILLAVIPAAWEGTPSSSTAPPSAAPVSSIVIAGDVAGSTIIQAPGGQVNVFPPVAHSAENSPTSDPSKTPSPTSTPLPSTPTPDPCNPSSFCDQVAEPCIWLPTPGDSWPKVATQTAFKDECRWPSIANVNRDPTGTYRELDHFLTSAGIMIPSPPGDACWPVMRSSIYPSKPIPACGSDPITASHPCLYTITAKDTAAGYFYDPLAWMFYGGIEKDHKRLDEYIMRANLVNGCDPPEPIRLKPGVTIVIPMLQ